MEYLTREMVEAFVDYIEIDGNMKIDIYWTFNNQLDRNNGNGAII